MKLSLREQKLGKNIKPIDWKAVAKHYRKLWKVDGKELARIKGQAAPDAAHVVIKQENERTKEHG